MNPTDRAALHRLVASLADARLCPLSWLDEAEAHCREVLRDILAIRRDLLARMEQVEVTEDDGEVEG